MVARLSEYTRAGLTFPVVDSGPADGPIAVLLHGFPQNSSSWGAVSASLNKAGIRTLAPDQRGYALTANPRGRWAFRSTELIADAAALIEAAGGRAHVVGHDWGANVAWGLAGEHPERVSSLTAVSVPHSAAFVRALLTSDQARRSWYMAAFQPPALPEAIVARRPQMFDAMLARTGMTADMIAAVHRDVIDRVGLTGPLNWYRALPFTARRPKRVQVPTTHVWSDGDAALGATGARLTEHYVDAPYRLHVMEGASHWIPDERPTELAAVIAERIASASD